MDRPMFNVVVISLAVQSSIAYSCAACENDTKVHLLLFSRQQRMMHTTISRRLRWRLELLALVLTSTGENAILCDDGEQTPPHFLPTTSIYTTTTNTIMHAKRILVSMLLIWASMHTNLSSYNCVYARHAYTSTQG